jgi:hypothetical protein
VKDTASTIGCPQPEPMSTAACPCNDGKIQTFTTTAMEMPPIGCPRGWTPEECDCCPSGVVDVQGKCCLSAGVLPTVDAEGECCSAGYVDVCGICGGDGDFVDRRGTCCKVSHPGSQFYSLSYDCPFCMSALFWCSYGSLYTVSARGMPTMKCTMQDTATIDGNGLCCDGEVDVCGVCGGDNTSCGTIVELFAIINITGYSDDNNVLEGVKFTAEEIIANSLNYPNVLVSVKDIDEIELPKEEMGGYGGGSPGQYGDATHGQYGGGAPGNYGGKLDLYHGIDHNMIGGPDSDAILSAVKVHFATRIFT